MARDSRTMRGEGPFVFAQVTNGIGVEEIAAQLLSPAGSGRQPGRLLNSP